ncbi:hypothetical protein [Bacillus sp. KH172YL63]|uniref:hypothetical protein n=1 Tax=Bacillus sp. KH172YL63 TaxID=2709784 RepID=UPI0013E4F403|nr:hypothetical protein [Bacillus sp. KH172YL63]BCB02468.1 hypothetical protein KH172YL63_06010 [Bacillus sp. KH172YL63]
MDRELQRQIRKMTEEGLDGFDFNDRLKGGVRERLANGKPKKEYRRRWYAPVISLMIMCLLVFLFAVVKGEQWGPFGNGKLSGFFSNKANFDVELRYDEGPVISTFTDTIVNGDEQKPLALTPHEMNVMYEKVESMNLHESQPVSGSGDCLILASRTYTMKIRMNKDVYEYHYSDCGTDRDRREWEELRELIISILKEKGGYEEMLRQKLVM